MKSISNYLDFLKEKGRSLAEFIPGSIETALTISDVLQALELLKDNQIAILGADILSEEKGKLVYAIHLWGHSYHYLNWYCNKNDTENRSDYLERSYELARAGIANASKTAEKLKKKSYIVFVTE